MNLAVAITLAVALLAAFGASLAWRFARTEAWTGLRRFATVASLTALYGLLQVATLLADSPRAFEWSARLFGTASVLVAWGWLAYSDVLCAREPGRLERRLRRAMLGVAAVTLVPGVTVGATERRHLDLDPILGLTWRHAPMTPVGIAVAAGLLAVGLLVEGRLIAAWRRGSSRAGAVALAFGLALPFAFSDVFVHADLARAPHLLGIALALPLAAAAWIVVSQFVSDAQALHELRRRLEGLVEERTRELAEANAALLQAEKLAALGQFAAGVGHEVSNPASVVTADLAWLSGALTRGVPLPEAKEVLDESIDAMWRINDLVRKLLDAGRLADLPPSAGTVPLAGAVERAFAGIRELGRTDVELVNDVPDDLLVRGGAPTVEQIVANLVRNGVEAIPAGRAGRVEVSARAIDSSVRLVVEDDGAGMGIEALRRAFDPFFTTKALGRGNGLGLPITRGLVEGIGGQIWLESEPGKGTRAAVELPVGTPS